MTCYESLERKAELCELASRQARDCRAKADWLLKSALIRATMQDMPARMAEVIVLS